MARCAPTWYTGGAPREGGLAAGPQPSKLETRVRLPSLAPLPVPHIVLFRILWNSSLCGTARRAPWRRWMAQTASNGKAAGSSPAGVTMSITILDSIAFWIGAGIISAFVVYLLHWEQESGENGQDRRGNSSMD